MNIEINRNLVVPIYTQIVGQIQFGIVSGRLPFGDQLPSIRDLAQELNVAPMTITQAYQELKQRLAERSTQTWRPVERPEEIPWKRPNF